MAEAQNAYRAALDENPNFLPPYYSLATIYRLNNEQDKAISQYKALLDKNPNQTRPHMMLGTIYDLQNKPDLAEKHYRLALKIDPDFIPAVNNLAYRLADNNEGLDQALTLARKAKEKYPDDPRIMDTLGWVYYKRGLYANAITELHDSLKKMPENPEVNYHLGMAHYQNGDTDLARKYLNLARKYLNETLSLDKAFYRADEVRQILAE